MKKSIFIPIFIISSIFLTGCLRKKQAVIKKSEIKEFAKIEEVQDNNEHQCCCDNLEFINSNKDLYEEKIIKKSIFDEDENNDGEIIIEHEFPIETLSKSGGGKTIINSERGVIGKSIGIVHFDFDVY